VSRVMPRREYSSSYNSEEDSSTNSWRSISQGDFEANLTRFRSSARGMGRRSDEALNKPWTPEPKKDKKKKKKSKKRHRNSTSSALSNGSESSSPRNARTQSTGERGRSKSNFREESKHDFESRKERLKRKEEEAIRREFKKRNGYGMSSDSESSSESDSDNQYTSTNSNSYTSESESESDNGDLTTPYTPPRPRRDDASRDKKDDMQFNSTPDKRRAPSESSECTSEELNPFMRLSQLQRQRDEQDPTRVTPTTSGYRKSDESYAKQEREDADDFLANRRRLGDAEYYRPHEADPHNYNIRTEEPDNNVCSCVIS